ncbi:hypothetical protein BDW75DRAFT_232055 [Aspergillus navahoensis]
MSWHDLTAFPASTSNNSSRGRFSSIPIVDLSTLNSSVSRCTRSLKTPSGRPALRSGTFTSTISGELIDRTFEAAHKFLCLSEEQKMVCYVAKSKSQSGLARADEKPAQGALSEASNIEPDDPPPQDEFGLHGENQWPDERLLPGFSVEYPGVAPMMLHYPPHPVEGQGIPGQAAHTDGERFTILAQERGHWVAAPPIPGTLVVDIATWSDHQLKTTIHRLINLTEEERYSISFFFGVDYWHRDFGPGKQGLRREFPLQKDIYGGRTKPLEPTLVRTFSAVSRQYVLRKLSNGYIRYDGEHADRENVVIVVVKLYTIEY